MLSFSFATSAAVRGAACAVEGVACAVVVGGAAVLGGAVVVGGVVVGGAGTGAGGLGGGSSGSADGNMEAPDMTHHTTSARAAAAITLMTLRSMVALQSPPPR